MGTRLHIALVAAAALALAGAASANEDPRSGALGLGRFCPEGSLRPLGTGRITYAAVVTRRATAFSAPGRRRLGTFERLNANGVPTVLGVRGVVVDGRCRAQWYRVQLPMRPNGIVGYVRKGTVGLGKV